MNYSHQQSKYRVEHQQGREGGEVPFVLAANLVPDHISRPEQDVREGSLCIIVQERDDGLAGALEDAYLLLLGRKGLAPGDVPQLAVNCP